MCRWTHHLGSFDARKGTVHAMSLYNTQPTQIQVQVQVVADGIMHTEYTQSSKAHTRPTRPPRNARAWPRALPLPE